MLFIRVLKPTAGTELIYLRTESVDNRVQSRKPGQKGREGRAWSFSVLVCACLEVHVPSWGEGGPKSSQLKSAPVSLHRGEIQLKRAALCSFVLA